MRILIIEDELRLVATLADLIGEAGWHTDISHDGSEGLALARNSTHDAIFLDVMLPGMNGYKILENLRSARILTPVLMLTARAQLCDRVKGLDAGADYYLTKPFENEELMACLRSILRKGANTAPDSFFLADLILTPSTSKLSRGNLEVALSAREMELMRLLIQNSSQYLSKDSLLLKVWGYDSTVNENNVEAYISFLRKKLSLLHSSARISVARNIGYKLEVSK